jgi:carbon storage regulator
MLVLGRKAGEKIVVPDCEVTFTILEVRGHRVRVGISAPASTAVYREEVWRQVGRPGSEFSGRWRRQE